jgi:hypothetical protein
MPCIDHLGIVAARIFLDGRVGAPPTGDQAIQEILEWLLLVQGELEKD